MTLSLVASTLIPEWGPKLWRIGGAWGPCWARAWPEGMCLPAAAQQHKA